MEKENCLYILESEKIHKYYVGSTRNLDERLKEHNSGKVKYTKNNRPYKLVFSQQYKSYYLAHQAEMKLKKWKSKKIIDKIIKDKKFNYI